jgi:ADP-ribosylglycohydrolase
VPRLGNCARLVRSAAGLGVTGVRYRIAVLTRIIGCLKGVATGDAIGKQTEGLTRDDVLRWYPAGLRGFENTPGTVIPRYVGNKKHEWLVGETTDDTERTIAVARAILHDGEVRHASVGREMLPCTKSVHPGVKSLWSFHQANDPARVTNEHDGCGAAVRVSPVGILYKSHRLDDLVAGARQASISTHGGPLALAAAAATAAAVSAAIDGASAAEILGMALRAAELAEGQRSGSSSFAGAVRAIHGDLAGGPEVRFLSTITERHFPDRSLTKVPVALALATTMESAEHVMLLATNVGGDSDSVASIQSTPPSYQLPATSYRLHLVHDLAVDDRQYRPDLLDVGLGDREVVAIEDDEVGQPACLDRAEPILHPQEPAVPFGEEAQRLLTRQLLIAVHLGAERVDAGDGERDVRPGIERRNVDTVAMDADLDAVVDDRPERRTDDDLGVG